MTASRPPDRRTAVIAANSAWNILNFRLPVVKALLDDGWKVVALSPPDRGADSLEQLGLRFVPIQVDSSGTSVFKDLRLFSRYWSVLRDIRPDAFLGFTIKPNIYGSLAANLLGIKVINNISGLGTAFLQPGPLNRLVRQLYRWSLHGSARVFFQNSHDRDLFVAEGLVRPSQSQVIPGSGIDLERFQPLKGNRSAGSPFRFLFVGRLLRDKGLVEYAEAARMLRPDWPNVEFAILGFAGSDNRSAVPIAEVERWQAEGSVMYLGEAEDVRSHLANCDCVVLPSYREGLPRSLLEAAAMAKPMIATDVPGCRDVVRQGENGLLCEARSAGSLASAMAAMIRLSASERNRMGEQARRLVELEFDQARVAQAYIEALK